jgi:hypothetical protein
MGFLKPKSPTLVPVPSPSDVLTPATAPIGSSPAGANRSPSFLASAALPPASTTNTGGKQLLGQ